MDCSLCYIIDCKTFATKYEFILEGLCHWISIYRSIAPVGGFCKRLTIYETFFYFSVLFWLCVHQLLERNHVSSILCPLLGVSHISFNF
jgi:hypothetical protein